MRASRETAETRRAFLIGGAAAATGLAVAVPTSSARASAAEPESGGDDRLRVDVRDHGALGDGTTDDTAAFSRAISAAARVRGRVIVPAGDYVIDSLTIPQLVRIEGCGADISRYGAGTSGGVNLRHLRSSTEPMLVIDGPGVTLESLGLQGGGNPLPLLRVENGFESRLSRVQLSGVPGTALVVNRVNNNLWSDVFVNGCGSESQAAVVVSSPAASTNSNTFTCVNLTIEGSRNVALDLAHGAAPGTFVEFVRLVALHIEGIRAAGTDDALVRIGNVRQVEFVSPFLYGGPGPAVEHHEQRASGLPLAGGIRVLGGCLLGADPKSGVSTADVVRLVRGDDFALVGTRVGRFTGAGVRIRAGYGARVALDPTTRIQNWNDSRTLVDDRPAPSREPWRWQSGIDLSGSLGVGGHMILSASTEPGPTAENLPAIGAGGPKPSIRGGDTAGSVAFGAGAAPAAGAQVRVAFGRPFDSAPTVLLTPASAATAGIRAYVVTDKTHFDVCLASPLPAGAWLKFSFVAFG